MTHRVGKDIAPDISAFTTSSPGAVPVSDGSQSKFLRADGSWATPPAGSDPWTYTSLASNSTVSTTAFANVTGLSFTAVANTTYLVKLIGAYQTAASNTVLQANITIIGYRTI